VANPRANTAIDNTITVMRRALALMGGNWSNAALCGASYVNLNNVASNTNTNIGARFSYYFYIDNAPHNRKHLLEIIPIKDMPSRKRQACR